MGKKISALVLVLLMVLTAFTPLLAMAETVKTPASDGSLVVRSGPGTKYNPATWVKNGQSITVLDRGSTWTKIKVDKNGKIGYIKDKYIAGSSSSGSETLSGNYDLGSVTTKYASSKVNLRKGPGTSYGTVAAYKRGALMRINGSEGNWYLVEASDGKTGYISKSYVSLGVYAKTSANVNLRSGAGTDTGVIKVVSNGTGVTALSVSGNWIKVKAGNNTGYLYNKYVKF